MSVDKIIHIYHNSENVLLTIEETLIYSNFSTPSTTMYTIQKDVIRIIVKFKIYQLIYVYNVKQITLISQENVISRIKYQIVLIYSNNNLCVICAEKDILLLMESVNY